MERKETLDEVIKQVEEAKKEADKLMINKITKYENQIDGYKQAIKNQVEINESHKKLNGELIVENKQLREDNKKLSQQISDHIKRHEDNIRKAGL